MSTADSLLLVAASSVVRDVYQKVTHHDHDVPQANLVRNSQCVVTALMVVSVIVGHLVDELVFWLVLFAWAGLGAALGPLRSTCLGGGRPRQVAPPDSWPR